METRDSDLLSSIPTSGALSDEEKMTLTKLHPPTGNIGSVPGPSSGGSTDPPQKASWWSKIKLALIAGILFLALANPFVDGFFDMIPFGSGLTGLFIKMFVFMMLFLVVYSYFG